jgi:hypothetical protein
MTYILTARERKLLGELQLDHTTYQIRGQLPVGTGKVTLERLTELGLLETGLGRFGETGWRLSDDGWRCMYGQTNDEIMAGGAPVRPLRIWSWPPTPDTKRIPTPARAKLSTLPPRLAVLPPRLKG